MENVSIWWRLHGGATKTYKTHTSIENHTHTLSSVWKSTSFSKIKSNLDYCQIIHYWCLECWDVLRYLTTQFQCHLTHENRIRKQLLMEIWKIKYFVVKDRMLLCRTFADTVQVLYICTAGIWLVGLFKFDRRRVWNITLQPKLHCLIWICLHIYELDTYFCW